MNKPFGLLSCYSSHHKMDLLHWKPGCVSSLGRELITSCSGRFLGSTQDSAGSQASAPWFVSPQVIHTRIFLRQVIATTVAQQLARVGSSGEKGG